MLSLFLRRKWHSKGDWIAGYYRTRYGAFEGKMRNRLFQVGDFYIRNPPSQMRSHDHWMCFHRLNKGWYRLHFDKKPKSVSEGIKAMELIILESFHISQGKNQK